MNCNYSRESLKGAKHTFGGYHTFSTPCSNKVLRVHCPAREARMPAQAHARASYGTFASISRSLFEKEKKL